MNKPIEHNATKAVDRIQQRLTNYACALEYDGLSQEAIHAAKARIIDTLGALIGGFFGEPCRIARNLAAQMPDASGATIIGTRMKTMLVMAALVNSTTARYLDMNDIYHSTGSYGGHPSDSLTPVLGVAEHMQASGRDFITAVVLAYEVFCRISDVFHNEGFCNTNFACLGAAIAGGKLMGLSSDQLSHCISMAVVPNIILRQARRDHISMFKAVTAGQAGRAGVFAALLARAGMEGPHLPFEGKAGWCDHVAGERFSLNKMGDNDTPFKISEALIKTRACQGNTIAAALAAEKVTLFNNIKDVKKITVEVTKRSKDHGGSGEAPWNPQSRETADHSIPYVTAAALIDGTITPRSFNDVRLWSPELRGLLQKTEVVENEEFTQAYHRVPREHRARVTVIMANGERLVGETGGDQDDLSTPKSDAQVQEKFQMLTEDTLGAQRVNAILDRLWHLEDLGNVAEIPPLFNFI